MNRPRILIPVVLSAALLLLVSADRAQQSPPVPKSQSPSPPAQNPQASPQSGQQATPQSGQTFKREVTLVDVLFTVLNRRNKLVPDLEQGDFKVFDEGKA